MRDQTREVAHLHCERESQNHGEATRLMHQVCEEADKANITLVLWAKPYGDDIALSQTQLIDWYAKRFGFQLIQQDPPLMARMPGATPQMLTVAASAVALYAVEPIQEDAKRMYSFWRTACTEAIALRPKNPYKPLGDEPEAACA
jgi:hypothetical protein